jgi:hypothetical protein
MLVRLGGAGLLGRPSHVSRVRWPILMSTTNEGSEDVVHERLE